MRLMDDNLYIRLNQVCDSAICNSAICNSAICDSATINKPGSGLDDPLLETSHDLPHLNIAFMNLQPTWLHRSRRSSA